MSEKIYNHTINYIDLSFYIPDVMNALYNEHAAINITKNELRDAFRIKMMQSKAWLIQNFLQQNIDKNKKILVVGGWLGFTSYVLYKNGYNNITEIDIDARLQNFSKHLNRNNHSFTHQVTDVNDVDTSNFEVIINTSCEHIISSKWFVQAKPETYFVLQSNNIDIPDHINKVYSIEEMSSKYALNFMYQGTLDYNDGTSRYMIIGKN